MLRTILNPPINKYLPHYDEGNSLVFLGNFDANNLYGWDLSNLLPFDNFKWIDPDSIGDISQTQKHGDTGYISILNKY